MPTAEVDSKKIRVKPALPSFVTLCQLLKIPSKPHSAWDTSEAHSVEPNGALQARNDCDEPC